MTLASMVVDIILNIVLVPIWGFWGCGIACFMTYFSRSLFALILSLKKNKDIRYNYVAMYGAPLLLLALSFIPRLLLNTPTIWSILIKVLICSMLGGLFYWKYKESLIVLASQLKSKKK